MYKLSCLYTPFPNLEVGKAEDMNDKAYKIVIREILFKLLEERKITIDEADIIFIHFS